MGKFRVRTKGAKRGVRWAKGHSSSSNPAGTRHRDAAKARMALLGPQGVPSQPPPGLTQGPSRLTAESLLRHDVLLAATKDEGGDEVISLGQTEKTFDTFASDWTQCTNTSFSRVMKHFNPANAHHKEMLAVVAAVTEVINERGGEGNSTEYLSALLTTLEATATAESRRAVVALLAMVVKTVKAEVLQAKFGVLSEPLVKLLRENNDDPALVRGLIGCLSVALRAQSEQRWREEPFTGHVFHSVIMNRIRDPKPKIRRAAQHAVCAVIRSSLLLEDSSPSVFHPMAAETVKTLTSWLRPSEDLHGTLYSLSLLKEVTGSSPEKVVVAACEKTLGLLEIGAQHPHLRNCAMQMLHGLFAGRPAKETLAPECNARLVNALYDHMPSVNDSQAMVSWLAVMQEALINLGFLDPVLLLAHLPKFFRESRKCWLSDRKEVRVGVTAAMKALVNESMRTHAKEWASGEGIHKLKDVFSHVRDGLDGIGGQQFTEVLQVMAAILDCAGEHCPDLLAASFLPKLAERHAAAAGDDGAIFLCNKTLANEIEYVVGCAVRRLGPENVLTVVDHNITGDEGDELDLRRSWLLPVLRDNVGPGSSLAYFRDKLVPLAMKLWEKAEVFAERKDNVKYKTFHILALQLWSTLPGFCRGPVDMAATFNSKKNPLGKAMCELLHQEELRLDVMAALRNLITFCRKDDHADDRTSLAIRFKPFRKNLLALYTDPAVDQGHRLAAYETFKTYVRIANPEDLNETYDEVWKIWIDETNKKSQESMQARGKKKIKKKNEGTIAPEYNLDILRALAPWLKDPDPQTQTPTTKARRQKQDSNKRQDHSKRTEDRVRELCEAMGKKIFSTDHHEQKKAYRVLEDLCSLQADNSSEECRAVVTSVLLSPTGSQLQTLRSAFSRIHPPSQASRLRCLVAVIERLEGDAAADFVRVIIPEAVLCIKAENERARTTAFQLIRTAGDAFVRQKGDDEVSGVRELLDALAAPLKTGGHLDPTLIQCSLLALAKAAFEFRAAVPEAHANELLEHACAFIAASGDRQIVGAALSFVKVFVQVNPVERTGKRSILETIVISLTSMKDDCKRHFRQKTRDIMVRLVRKFGHDIISSLAKNDIVMLKRLKNIRKEQDRKKRKTAEEEDIEDEDEDDHLFVRGKKTTMEEILNDSDDDLMDVDDAESGRRGKRRNSRKPNQTVISETEGIVDFMDSSAAQKVASQRPNFSKKDQIKKTGDEFPVSKDGRIIIKDSDDDDDDFASDDAEEKLDKKKQSLTDRLMKDSSDEEEDGRNNFASLVSSRKRKRQSVNGSQKSEPAMKYRTGGSGIHRALPAPGSEYRSSKARGDVKRKGRPDPFAYVPLQRSALNKRKRKKTETQFKTLVSAAKTGAISGDKKQRKAKRTLSKNMKKLSI